jgi:hypothetical protein
MAGTSSIIINGFILFQRPDGRAQVELTDSKGNIMYVVVDTKSNELISIDESEEASDEYMFTRSME